MADETQILSPARHEARDAQFKHIAAGAAWVALAVAVVLLASLWMFPHTMTDQYVATPLPRFAAPTLQSHPPADWRAFAAAQDRALNGLAWIDRSQGTVHLPIQDAMRKLAHDGIADWPKP